MKDQKLAGNLVNAIKQKMNNLKWLNWVKGKVNGIIRAKGKEKGND